MTRFDMGSTTPSVPAAQSLSNKPRGFAYLKLHNPARLQEITSAAGKRAHELGTAHEFTSKEAGNAARIGHVLGVGRKFTRDEAVAAGRKGGLASAAKRKNKTT